MVSRPEDSHRRVLIVDPSADTRLVLRTMLQRTGVEILEAQRAADGLDLARQYQPNVVVLDVDSIESSDAFLRDEFDSSASATHTALVLLGSASWEADVAERRPDVIAKPYHYGPLVRKIEALLRRTGAGRAGEPPG